MNEEKVKEILYEMTYKNQSDVPAYENCHEVFNDYALRICKLFPTVEADGGRPKDYKIYFRGFGIHLTDDIKQQIFNDIVRDTASIKDAEIAELEQQVEELKERLTETILYGEKSVASAVKAERCELAEKVETFFSTEWRECDQYGGTYSRNKIDKFVESLKNPDKEQS